MKSLLLFDSMAFLMSFAGKGIAYFVGLFQLKVFSIL